MRSSSLFTYWFMRYKVDVTLDEARRHRRTHLRLTDHEMESLDNGDIERIYHSQIIHLFLNKNELNDLPRDFGFYGQNLVTLTLAYNKFTQLPSSIANLGSLKVLNISHNKLCGDELPVIVCELKNLHTLYANHSNVRSIPEEFYQMTELKVLGLRNNYLKSIPSVLLGLPKLQKLTLANNCIDDIPLQLLQAKVLVHLNLNGNRISVIPSNMFDQIQNLRYLFLESNRLVVNEKLINEIQKIQKLRRVHLAHNTIKFECEQSSKLTRKLIVTPNTILKTIPVVEEIWKHSSGLRTESSFNIISQRQKHCDRVTTVEEEFDPIEDHVLEMSHSSVQSPLLREDTMKTNSEPIIIHGFKLITEITNLQKDRKPFQSHTKSERNVLTQEINSFDSNSTTKFNDQLEENKSIQEISSVTVYDNEQVNVEVNERSRNLDQVNADGFEAEREDHRGQEVEDANPNGNDDDNDNSYVWEKSIMTNDLDDIDFDSDMSELEEIPFDQPEARFALCALLF